MIAPSEHRPSPPHVIGFFSATIVWSWLFFFPVTLWLRDRSLDEAPWFILLALLLGAYGPSLMGLVFAARESGRQGIRVLLGRLVLWRVGVRWYLIGLLVPTAIVLAAALLFAARGGSLGPFESDRLALAPIALLAALPFGPLGEELGWRGFALPRLVERYGAVGASIVIGVVWALWHTPLFWAPAGTPISGGPVSVTAVAGYAGVLIGNSVLYTWVLARTRASVLMAVLLHAGFNADLALLPFPGRAESADLGLLYFSLIPLAAAVAMLVPRLRGVRNLAP